MADRDRQDLEKLVVFMRRGSYTIRLLSTPCCRASAELRPNPPHPPPQYHCVECGQAFGALRELA